MNRKNGVSQISGQGLRILLLIVLCVSVIGKTWGQTNSTSVPSGFFTDVSQLNSGFAIVNVSEGKALYGSNNQNMAYSDYATAFASSNAVTMFKVVGNQVNGGYLLQAITPSGGNYGVYGANPSYLNAQPSIGGVTFILGLNNQNGQDMTNGAVWKLNYVEGSGWTMQCVGNDGYCAGTTTSSTPVYWQFCSLAQPSTVSGYTFISNETNGYFINSSAIASQTFTEGTCVWTADATLDNQTKRKVGIGDTWLRGDGQGNSGTITTGGNNDQYRGRWLSNNNYLYYNTTNGRVYRDGTQIKWSNANNLTNLFGSYTTCTKYDFDILTVSDITEVPNEISSIGTFNLSSSASYTPPYYKFTGGPDTRYYSSGYTTGAVTSIPVKTSNFSSDTWTLSSNLPGLSINNSGQLSYTTLVESDIEITITHTVTENGTTQSASKTILLRAPYAFRLINATGHADGTSWSASAPEVHENFWLDIKNNSISANESQNANINYLGQAVILQYLSEGVYKMKNDAGAYLRVNPNRTWSAIFDGSESNAISWTVAEPSTGIYTFYQSNQRPGYLFKINYFSNREALYINSDATTNGRATQWKRYYWSDIHTITKGNVTNGDIEISTTADGWQMKGFGSYAKNDEVTLTATPETGYELGNWVVTCADGTSVTVNDNKFTMPNNDVTISATFVKNTTLEFEETAPTISSTGIQLPAVILKDNNGTILTGNTISYAATGCQVSSSGIVTNITGTTVTVTASFAGDQTYAASQDTYTFSATSHEALNESSYQEISITPSSATLGIDETKTYTVPATLTAVTRSREAYSEFAFPTGKLYLTNSNTFQESAPAMVEQTGTQFAFTSVNWNYSGGRGQYFQVSSDYSTTNQSTTLTRTTTKTSDSQDYTITATVTYGSITRTATATVTIPFSYVDLSAIYPNPTNYTVAVNETATIAYTTNQEGGVGRPYINLTFTSNDTDIATVDADGVITGVAEGTTTITIQSHKVDGTDGVNSTVQVVVSNGTGDPNNPYRIMNVSGLERMNTYKDKSFLITADFDASSFNTNISGFSGTLDGAFHTLSGLTQALFNTITNNCTIKNVILDNVDISANTNGNAGAIVNEASGNARIYNCAVLASEVNDFISDTINEDKPFTSSSKVTGTAAVGGIAGLISNNVRVINCVSYADIFGGTYGAGIVGRYTGNWINNKGDYVNGNGNMVMNCLMLGDIKSGTNQYPIVGGNTIATGISLYSYFRFPSMPNVANMTQNGALCIDEDKWLNRWEFFRSCLNNHRDLAAVYCFNDGTRKSEMAKWTINESISPWPILKAHDDHTRKTLDRVIPTTTEDNAGKQLGTLAVTVNINGSTRTVDLPITDMDHAHYDYTWGKVILPFANEFTGWTPETTTTDTYDRIIIGWEITSLTGGTTGTFSDYNFADRNCTAKDVYNSSTNPFIYAQGGMFIVPNGVTDITITAHWANAYYVADQYYDMETSGRYLKGSGQAGSLSNNAGKRPTGNTNSRYNGKKIYTSIKAAQDAGMESTYSVHSQAVVLVGNYHYDLGVSGLSSGKGFSLMSIDEDCDQEPDYGFYNATIGSSAYNQNMPSARWDFVPCFTSGVFQICGTPGNVNSARATVFSCVYGKGWWEFTETSLSRVYQLEVNDVKMANPENGNGNNAYIINGGCHVQLTRTSVWGPLDENNKVTKSTSDRVSYLRVGGNAYIKEFFQGNHSDKDNYWTLRPVIVTGGEIEQCYMTGQRNASTIVTNNPDQPNNVRFYCAGGKIGKFLGSYMEYPVNDMNAWIDHAIVKNFYGGGTNQNGRVRGNINVNISNSYVQNFFGGPEFGDMETGKAVTVNANNCTFGSYYGAGYGGTSLTLVKIKEYSSNANTLFGIDAYNFNNNGGPYALKRDNTGVATEFVCEDIMNARGQVCQRFYIRRAALSLATTGNVTSTLTNCKVLSSFYGGGCQGKVNGTITSTLNNCEIMGDAFGGGYKTDVSTIDVMERDNNRTTDDYASFNYYFGYYTSTKYTTPVKYKWEYVGTTMPTGNPYGTNDNGENVLYTTTNTSDMGVVTGAISLTIQGGTVGENVYGGGNESPSRSTTTVNITGNAVISGDAFGGANAANVGGAATLNIQGGTLQNAFGGNNASGTIDGQITLNVHADNGKNVKVEGSVYGGGNLAPYTGSPDVNVINGVVEGSVFGGGLGETAVVTGDPNVTIGLSSADEDTDHDATQIESHQVTVDGSVYGGGSQASVVGDTKVLINGNLVNGECDDQCNGQDARGILIKEHVFGGGLGANAVIKKNEEASAGGNTEVKVVGSVCVGKNVYGGGNGGDVEGDTDIIIGEE